MTEEGPARAKRATRAMVAEARRLYETTDLARREIAARVKIPPRSLDRMVRAKGWRRAEPEPGRTPVVRRLKARVDEQIAAVERVLAEGGRTPALDAADRAARTLASLVHTLRELQKYDLEQARAAGRAGDEDAGPADLDALRDALADRLARLRQGEG